MYNWAQTRLLFYTREDISSHIPKIKILIMCLQYGELGNEFDLLQLFILLMLNFIYYITVAVIIAL